MASPELITPASEQVQPTETVSTNVVQEASIPSEKFVMEALALSVKSGRMTEMGAVERSQNWFPSRNIHPGLFKN